MSWHDIIRDRARGLICTGGHLAARGATESKVRLVPFCLAERQVSPSARPPPPPPLLPLASPHLTPGRVSTLVRAFVAIAPLTRTRAHMHARRISRYSRTSGSWSNGYIGI